MCIAIYKPKGIAIKKTTLANCFSNNPDGAGHMYIYKERLHIEKGFFTFAEFWEQYKFDSEKYRKSPFLVHFRIATSGMTDFTNCHPFRISEEGTELSGKDENCRGSLPSPSKSCPS